MISFKFDICQCLSSPTYEIWSAACAIFCQILIDADDNFDQIKSLWRLINISFLCMNLFFFAIIQRLVIFYGILLSEFFTSQCCLSQAPILGNCTHPPLSLKGGFIFSVSRGKVGINLGFATPQLSNHICPALMKWVSVGKTAAKTNFHLTALCCLWWSGKRREKSINQNKWKWTERQEQKSNFHLTALHTPRPALDDDKENDQKISHMETQIYLN